MRSTPLLELGDTFINLNPGSPEHLWVVTTPPDHEGSVVIFNVTTRRPGCDTTCVVVAGEHPFVKHESVIQYNRGQVFTATALDALRRLACFQAHAAATRHLVYKIQRGALDSERTPQKLQEIVSRNLITLP